MRRPARQLCLLLALASPTGITALPRVLDEARLHQTRVTNELQAQARAGLELFIQAVLDHPANAGANGLTAEVLWHDGMILVYRLLFILKLESATDPARTFGFAVSRLWRESLSPNQALGPLARRRLDQGHDTGTMLDSGLRQLFRACRDGLICGEMAIAPLGGALFGPGSTHRLDDLRWGDQAVALLLDRLLWTTRPGQPRERVHFGLLDVEDLGSVYESLLDLEPGIATQALSRQRRGRQETITPGSGPDTIPKGRFFLRAAQGRKAIGAYYTPTGFVRYLVRETLGPRLAALSPDDDPNPAAILSLRVVDPATGSGHFLVEACRFLADALHAACRTCDAVPEWRGRLAALPDPDRLLESYLPSRCRHSTLSEQRALALCRRLVAAHCLYGADRNRLAVELAKLSLWLESHAVGLPLTFVDHRLLHGDSIGGPFLADLFTLPVGGAPLDPLLARGIAERLTERRDTARREVRLIQATIGRDLADLALKHAAGERLAAAMNPLRQLARAWSGAAMLGARESNDEFLALARQVADTGVWPATLSSPQTEMLTAGTTTLSWDLMFPDVFDGGGSGFHAVLGNPPWDVIQYNTRDFVAGFDLSVMDATTKRERLAIEQRVLSDPAIARTFTAYKTGYDQRKRLSARLFHHQRVGAGNDTTAGNLDLFRLFAERAMKLAAGDGSIGMLMPSAFHANEGTTGIRRLYLANGLQSCLSFENRRGIFDIDSRFKFALVIAHRGTRPRALRCAFYLESIADVDDPDRIMRYDRAFIDRLDSDRQTFLELRGPADLRVAERLFAAPTTFGTWCREQGIRFGCDIHMTHDAAWFTPVGRTGRDDGRRLLHEGKTFHEYTDRWDTAPRYQIRSDALTAKPVALAASTHFRLAFRDIARSTDERSAIATIMPPGVVLGHTATTEKHPTRRDPRSALALCAVFNSFPFDWLVRQKTAAHLSLYLIEPLPFPRLDPAAIDHLAAAAASLVLFRDGHTLPAHGAPLTDPTARLLRRATIDALVARLYGLTEADYARILASFNHKRAPDLPTLCLAAFNGGSGASR